MSDKVTAPKIRTMKGQQRIVALTAYDVPSARIADAAGVDIILVGDSVGNVVLGYENTLPVTLAEMLHHTSAAARGCSRALLVADMPFGSYQASVSEAVAAGIALVKAGAEAVKLEGTFIEAIAALCHAGVPVMGHVGMTPQSVNAFGGFRVQGRGQQGDRVLEAANAIAEAGAFSIVVEMVPAITAKKITDECPIPTIGIGAGVHCDGEVQVFHDVLGIAPGEPYRHAKKYLDTYELSVEAMRSFVCEVRENKFPADDNSF